MRAAWLVFLAVAGCAAAEAVSLEGEKLYPPPLAPEVQAQRTAQLAAAEAAWHRAPDDLEALLWYGRRLGYLARYREAIAVFGEGIRRHPQDPRPYRHRGHRYLSVRRLAAAAADLERAAALLAAYPDEIEPAGLPNARGIELDWLHHSVYYHLGLAYYLQGRYAEAQAAYAQCVAVSRNPDALCSASYWWYLALCRAGDPQPERALRPIRADFDLAEYGSYHQLCLVFRGARDPRALWAEALAAGAASVDCATIGYGLTQFYERAGDPASAAEIRAAVLGGGNWPAFGYLAAEADRARQ